MDQSPFLGWFEVAGWSRSGRVVEWPVQYAKDCHQLFGKLVDVGNPDTPIDEELDIDIWTDAYPDVPYHFIRALIMRLISNSFWTLDLPPKWVMIANDLVGAIQRQTSFYF
ncbi:unnamed protein product [Calypogeia fissa]